MHLSRRQRIELVWLTLVWGLNWPIMKMGVTDCPPLTFRAISLWLGLPVLGLAMLCLKVPFFIPRDRYRELFWLAATNMFVWHAVMTVVVKNLSSGRLACCWLWWQPPPGPWARKGCAPPPCRWPR